ncbi:MAG: hypothetical protein ISP81_08125, partial [Synechococcus sp. BS301-5m-G54]|nr:hypothetical protein [Synechococcus sp. BS301-5m-G54]
MADSTPSLLDPRPEQWLLPERLQRLQDDLGGSAPFLALSGQLPTALEYWLRKETALELMAEPGVWADCEQELDVLEAVLRSSRIASGTASASPRPAFARGSVIGSGMAATPRNRRIR